MIATVAKLAPLVLSLPATTSAFAIHGALKNNTPVAPKSTIHAPSLHPYSTARPPVVVDMSAKGDQKTKVLFVCLGNICRSPSAEAVFKQVTADAGAAEQFEIDSCGTGGGSPNWYREGGFSYHEGNPPDERMAMAAANRGVKLAGASRPLHPEDFETFDLIIGMDAENARAISAASDHWGKSDLAQSKMRAMTAYCRSSGDIKKVPDPYYGGPQGFENVLDILDDACQGLLNACREGKA